MSNLVPSTAMSSHARPPPQMVTDYFVCVICMERLNDPRMCRTCSKMWCRTCIEEWMRHGQRNCPHCRRPLGTDDIVKCRWVEELMRVIEGSLIRPPSAAVVGGPCGSNNSASSSNSSAAVLASSSIDNNLASAADMCSVHREVVSIYCRSCKACICYRCAVFGEHKTHSFKPLEEVHEDRVKLLRSKLDGVKKRLIDVTHLLNGVERNQLQLRTARDERVGETRQALERIETGFERELVEKTGLLRNHAGRLDREARCLRGLIRTTDELITQYSKRQAIEKADEWMKELEMAQLPSMRQFRVPYIRPDCFPSPLFPTYDSATFAIGNFRFARSDARPLFSDPLTIRGVVWRLKVYPDGNGLVRGSHLSVFLELHGGIITPQQRSRYEYRIELCHQGRHVDRGDADTRLNYSRDCTSEFELNDSWGYNRFFELDRLEREAFWHAPSDTVKFQFYIRSPTFALKCDELERYARDLELANERLQRTNRRLQFDVELGKKNVQRRTSSGSVGVAAGIRRTSAALPSKFGDADDALGSRNDETEARGTENLIGSEDHSPDSITSLILAAEEFNKSATATAQQRTAPPRRRRLPALSERDRLRRDMMAEITGNASTSRYKSGPSASTTSPPFDSNGDRETLLITENAGDSNLPAAHASDVTGNGMARSLLSRLPFLRNSAAATAGSERVRAVVENSSNESNYLPWEFLTATTNAGGERSGDVESWQLYGSAEEHEQPLNLTSCADFARQQRELWAKLDFLTSSTSPPVSQAAQASSSNVDDMHNLFEANRLELARMVADDDANNYTLSNEDENDQQQQYVDYAVEQLLLTPPSLQQLNSQQQQQQQRKSFSYDPVLYEGEGQRMMNVGGSSFGEPSRARTSVMLADLLGRSSRSATRRDDAASPVPVLPSSPPTRRPISFVAETNSNGTPVAATTTPTTTSEETPTDSSAFANQGGRFSAVLTFDSAAAVGSDNVAADDVSGLPQASDEADAEAVLNLTFSVSPPPPHESDDIVELLHKYQYANVVVDSGTATAGAGVRNWCSSNSSNLMQREISQSSTDADEQRRHHAAGRNLNEESLLADELLLSSFDAADSGDNDANGDDDDDSTLADEDNTRSDDLSANRLVASNSISSVVDTVPFGASQHDVETGNDAQQQQTEVIEGEAKDHHSAENIKRKNLENIFVGGSRDNSSSAGSLPSRLQQPSLIRTPTALQQSPRRSSSNTQPFETRGAGGKSCADNDTE